MLFNLYLRLSSTPRKAAGPGILPLLDYFHTIYVVALVFELMDLDLSAYLSKQTLRVLPLCDVYAVAVQLTTALSFLRNKGILHRDIHMKNLLVSKLSTCEPPALPAIGSSLKISLTDFGWGTFGASEDSKSPSPLTGGPYLAGYRPPEIFLALGSRFTAKGAYVTPPYVPYSRSSCRKRFILYDLCLKFLENISYQSCFATMFCVMESCATCC